jgi:hypothetical protein
MNLPNFVRHIRHPDLFQPIKHEFISLFITEACMRGFRGNDDNYCVNGQFNMKLTANTGWLAAQARIGQRQANTSAEGCASGLMA